MLIRRIMGKKGRTTIPYEMRLLLGMRANDVLEYQMPDDVNCIIVKKADYARTKDSNEKDYLTTFKKMDDAKCKETLYNLVQILPPRLDAALYQYLIAKNPYLLCNSRRVVK